LISVAVSEALIGQVDVKTKIVHFYVQRNSSFSTANAVIPFELTRLDEGGAFTSASGIFTTPVPGIYHFDFSAVKSNNVLYSAIHLQVNGANVGLADAVVVNTGEFVTMSLSASLRLAAGDTVNLFNVYVGGLYDSHLHYTHFSGWLVEEVLM